MNKMAWFDSYERLYNEREAGEIDSELDDCDLAELADEELKDQMADRADLIHDEKKEKIGE